MSNSVQCKKCQGRGAHRRGDTCGTCKGSGRVVITVDGNGKIVVTPVQS